MPEIIPNYHPLLVHFTIALLSISVVFYIAREGLPARHRWREQWLHMANWSLWSGSVLTLATVIAGWDAYNTVAHDTPSHEAMTLHRNWALPTAVLFLLLGVVRIYQVRNSTLPGKTFLSAAFIAAIMLMMTGWLGAEAVYRYGLGVMALPKVESGADGHNHGHGSEVGRAGADGHNHSHRSNDKAPPEMSEDTHGHAH